VLAVQVLLLVAQVVLVRLEQPLLQVMVLVEVEVLAALMEWAVMGVTDLPLQTLQILQVVVVGVMAVEQTEQTLLLV
jgi:hypothetical protein